MSITSDAAPDELNSPFYQRNRELCLKWEKLIKSLGGKSEGKYNAWSYKIYGQVKTNYSWQIMISKSTYSSTGIASLNNWNVFENLELKTFISNSPDYFVIREKTFFDRFKTVKVLNLNRNYVIVGSQINYTLTQFITEFLNEPITSNHLYKISYKNGVLLISIHDYNKNHELINKLLNAKIKPIHEN